MSSGHAFKQAKAPGPAALPSRAQPPPLPETPRRTPDARLTTTLLKPGELDGYGNLLLFAESVVKGFFSGKHRSLDYGSNAEFAEYKAYQPGDPVSHVDWKVFARSRRLMVRKHRDEKEMTAWLLVDVSGSMSYQAPGRESKGLRAARTAAAMATLMQRQGDKFSLTLFNQTIGNHRPPGSTRRHLMECIAALENRLKRPSGGTNAHQSLDLCAPLFRHRGSLIVISDFFTEPDAFFKAISQFQHRGFEVLLLHVIDPDERLLPDVPMARFTDLETGIGVEATPDEIRAVYRREMETMLERMGTECTRRGIAWHLLRVEDPWKDALEAWLGVRGKTRTPAHP